MSKKKPGEYLDDGDIVFDEFSDVSEEVFNGLSDKDLSTKEGPFSFTCTKREYSHTKDGHNYHVVPDEEYDNLDFEGHTVLINERARKCSSFDVDDDGNITIFVSSLSEHT